ncbi:unnamed protein product [Ectocarpus sp. CCAP 1310/34]|nr:unnamed protein product [Ectocarpus sp. CCAP 1310/34]
MPRQATSEGWYRPLAAVIAAVVAVLVAVMRTEGAPCKRNPLLDREVDPANYEFGCADIKIPAFHRAERTELRRVLACVYPYCFCARFPVFTRSREHDVVPCRMTLWNLRIMLEGNKRLVGSGSVRDVVLVKYEGQTVVVKSLRRKDDPKVEKHRLVMPKREVHS